MNLLELVETHNTLVIQINELVELICNKNNHLFQLVNLEQINKFINIYFQVSSHDFSTKNENIKKIKLNYLNCDEVSNTNKVHAIVKWGKIDGSKASIKMSKDVLYNHMLTNPEDFINIYNIIINRQIDFTIEDIKKIPYDFLEFMFKEFAKTKPSTKSDSNSDSDDEESSQNIMLNTKEIFCINLLCGLDLTEKQIYCVLKYLTTCTNPKLMYWPSGKVKKFEGNLLPEIIKYYKTNPPNFLVNHRRNVGILLENQINHFYDLESYLESNNGIIDAREFTIEFPYMCYVYINSIDFTYESNKFDSKKFEAKSCLGSEIFVRKLKNYDICKKQEKSTNDFLPYTIIISENLDTTKPCPYVCVKTNNFIPKQITNLKIYGRAICLI